MSHGVDAPVKTMEAPPVDAHLDRPAADSDDDELTMSHHPMLPAGQLRDSHIQSSRLL